MAIHERFKKETKLRNQLYQHIKTHVLILSSDNVVMPIPDRELIEFCKTKKELTSDQVDKLWHLMRNIATHSKGPLQPIALVYCNNLEESVMRDQQWKQATWQGIEGVLDSKIKDAQQQAEQIKAVLQKEALQKAAQQRRAQQQINQADLAAAQTTVIVPTASGAAAPACPAYELEFTATVSSKPRSMLSPGGQALLKKKHVSDSPFVHQDKQSHSSRVASQSPIRLYEREDQKLNLPPNHPFAAGHGLPASSSAPIDSVMNPQVPPQALQSALPSAISASSGSSNVDRQRTVSAALSPASITQPAMPTTVVKQSSSTPLSNVAPVQPPNNDTIVSPITSLASPQSRVLVSPASKSATVLPSPNTMEQRVRQDWPTYVLDKCDEAKRRDYRIESVIAGDGELTVTTQNGSLVTAQSLSLSHSADLTVSLTARRPSAGSDSGAVLAARMATVALFSHLPETEVAKLNMEDLDIASSNEEFKAALIAEMSSYIEVVQQKLTAAPQLPSGLASDRIEETARVSLLDSVKGWGSSCALQ